MKEIKKWDEISENGVSLKAGIYVCQIVEVEDVQDKSYLKIYFEIIDGEFKEYFSNRQEKEKKWPFNGTFIRSYKDNALSYFKSFITAVEKSNPKFVWKWNENDLVDQKIVVVFGEEEYESDGEIKVSVKPVEIRSLIALKEGKIKIPLIKRLKSTDIKAETAIVAEEDLPF